MSNILISSQSIFTLPHDHHVFVWEKWNPNPPSLCDMVPRNTVFVVGRGWLFSEAAHVHRLLFLIWRWDRLSVETSHFLVNCHKNCSSIYTSFQLFFIPPCCTFFESNLELLLFCLYDFFQKKQGWIFRKERYQCGFGVDQLFFNFQTANFEQWLREDIPIRIHGFTNTSTKMKTFKVDKYTSHMDPTFLWLLLSPAYPKEKIKDFGPLFNGVWAEKTTERVHGCCRLAGNSRNLQSESISSVFVGRSHKLCNFPFKRLVCFQIWGRCPF